MGGLATSRRRVGFALGAGLLVSAALGLGADAGAAGILRFSASATADGGRLQFSVPGASVADQIIDGGGPVAHAGADSLGASSAFASLPYPGELGVIGPGIVASLVGAPQPPAYPFIAASRYPGASEQQVEYGPGYRLVAESDAASSAATASGGGAQGENRLFFSEATARVANGADGVTAEASNRFEGIAAGPLRIASVLSSAAVTRQPDAEPERKSELTVHGLTVDGQAFGFSEQGFVTGESTTPLPSSDPLASALEAAGVKLTYLKAETTPSGIVAPGLRIVMAQDVPGSTATIALTLGRASASVDASTESVELPSEQATAPADTGAAAATPPADPAGAVPASTPGGTPEPLASGFQPEWGHLVRSAPARVTAPPFVSPEPVVVGDLSGDPDLAADATAAAAAAPTKSAADSRRDEVAVGAPRVLRGVGLATKIDADMTFFPLLVLAGLVLFGGLQAARLTGGAR